MNQKTRLDVRIIKYEDYIKKYPDSAYGYYCLGALYFLDGNLGKAEKMYRLSLEKDRHYTRSKLGLLELMLEEERFLPAAHYYNMNRFDLTRKNIFIIKLNRIISRLFNRMGKSYKRKIFSSFLFHHSIAGLTKMFERNQDNVIVHLLLAMYYLHEEPLSDKALLFYHLCVGLEGIDDFIRWKMVSALSKNQKHILTNLEIASSFENIPDSCYDTKYLNFIISAFLNSNAKNKIENTMAFVLKNSLPIYNKNLWKYVLWCRKNKIYTSTLLLATEKLILSGWIDKYLVETAKELERSAFVFDSPKIHKILNLYVYKR